MMHRSRDASLPPAPRFARRIAAGVARSVLALAVALPLVAPRAGAQVATSVEAGYRDWARRDTSTFGPVLSGRMVALWRGVRGEFAANLLATGGSDPVRGLNASLSVPFTLGRRSGIELRGGIERDAFDPVSERSLLGVRATYAMDVGRVGVSASAGWLQPWSEAAAPSGMDFTVGANGVVGQVHLYTAVRYRGLVQSVHIDGDSTGVDPKTCRAQMLAATRVATVCLGQERATVVELGGMYRAGSFQFGLRGGSRLANRSTLAGPPMWIAASASVPLTARTNLVAQLADLPVDVVRQVPARRMPSLGVRLDVLGGSVRPSVSPDPAPGTGSAEASESATIDDGPGDGTMLLRVAVRAARTVAVRGDMTRWRALTMSRAATGAWELRVPVRRGVQHLVVSVDERPWRPLRGAPLADDGFGGDVSVVVAPKAPTAR